MRQTQHSPRMGLHRRSVLEAIARRSARAWTDADSRARSTSPRRVMSELLLDRAGRRRSPATMSGFHAGQAPGNKGLRYPADPPKIEEIIAVMRTAGDGTHGRRLRGLIVVMWRAGLRIQEALALGESDLDLRRGSLLVRRGKAGAVAAWTPGLGTASALARHATRPPDRAAALRHQRRDARPPPVIGRGPRPTAAHGRRGRCGAGSRHTSSGTPTPSRWLAKAYR